MSFVTVRSAMFRLLSAPFSRNARWTSAERGGMRISLGIALLLVGLAVTASGLAGSQQVATGSDGLRVQKSSAGLHGGAREYSIEAKNHGGPTTGTATVTDVLDPAIFLIAFHDVGSGWSCPFPGQGTNKTITCTKAVGDIDDDFEDVLMYDACDTLTDRSPESVDNDVTIAVSGTPHDADQANPSVPECITLTTTPTATATQSPTSTATVTGTPPTATTTPTTTNTPTQTNTPTVTATTGIPLTLETPTNTPVPPTNTTVPTNTSVPTATNTPLTLQVGGVVTQPQPQQQVGGAVSGLPRSGTDSDRVLRGDLLALGVLLTLVGAGVLVQSSRNQRQD